LKLDLTKTRIWELKPELGAGAGRKVGARKWSWSKELDYGAGAGVWSRS